MHLISSGNSVDMVYLDFAKVFDNVSLDSPVLSGVPQGTVLSPLVFIILMGDINRGISSSSIGSFADDTRLYHVF